MRETVGNIWSFAADHWIVITTNIGWKTNGENIMGAGIAKDARDRWPKLAAWYGGFCQSFRSETPVVTYITDEPDVCRLILFPTKPLNEATPHLSWRSNSTLTLVTRSARQLAELDVLKSDERNVALPIVGCGMGKLNRGDVLPILRSELKSDRFLLVNR